MIPYSRQCIDEDDIQAVVDVLRSDYLTTGTKVDEFEQAISRVVGTKYAVAVSSGTAALHAAMYALDIKEDDEVILPPMTFAATANAVVYQGARPIFVDVDPDTLLIDPEQLQAKITSKTKAIIGVDYAGQPCDWDALQFIADKNNLYLVADACHSLGAKYKGQAVGSLADVNVFSFHPVKNITTGEGGMVTTNSEHFAKRMYFFRNHGITRESRYFKNRKSANSPSWYYEMVELGHNYRITDIQCGLGFSQLIKLSNFIKRRQKIASMYDRYLADIHGITPLYTRYDVVPLEQLLNLSANQLDNSTSSLHAYHLYVVCVEKYRDQVFWEIQQQGIGVNVHYIPVHLHPFYQQRFGTYQGLCPEAEKAYEKILSLPIWPGMTDEQVNFVIKAIKMTLERI